MSLLPRLTTQWRQGARLVQLTPRAAVCRLQRYTTAAEATSGETTPKKYTLRKLDSAEIKNLESKISSHGKPVDSTKAPPQDNGVTGAQQGNSTSETAVAADNADEVVLTDSAIKRLLFLSEKRGATQYLRLRVDSGGCYGFSYMLDMTDTPEKDDIVIDRRGAKMVIDNISLPLVRGATIDWQDRLIGQAFLVVANPQSSGGCGCGSSFEIKLN